jgi:DNA-binding NtrC family response regulator
MPRGSRLSDTLLPRTLETPVGLSDRILLIDTEGDLLGALSREIEAAGFHVEIVADGRKALELVDLVSFDVVILEAGAPETGGLDTLGRIKQSRPETEVIILTGCESAETALAGMQDGAFDYLLKPCDSETLLERIHRAQEKKEIGER